MAFVHAVKPRPRRRKSDRAMARLHLIYRATGAVLIIAMVIYVVAAGLCR